MRAFIWIVLVAIAAVVYFFATTTAPDEDNAAASGTLETEPTIGLIDDARINAADSEPGNWLAYGRTYEEQRFSPLTQINRETVGELGLAWYKDMGTNRALEATPIVVDGIMFFSTTWSRVHAVDARTVRPPRGRGSRWC